MRTVVVGVDGSEGGNHAMMWAAGEAARLAAALVVIHAYAVPVGVGAWATASWSPDPRADAEDLLARARARFDRTARVGAHSADSADVGFATVRGDASAVLVHEARHGAVVVVGRRGVGTFDRVHMGSVSSSVAGVAPGTVVVVPRAARVQPPRRVVVAVDPRDASERVLETGFDAADRAGVPLVAAHAVDEGMFVGVTEGDLAWLGRLRAEARADLEAQASRWGEKYPAVRWSVESRGGAVPGALLSVLRSDDLVVTGGHERARRVGRVRGSVPDRLVRHAPCAVTVVHE
ncbi:universal stress protein [Krasilnikoviella flava]|uniref:Nucleotide-binding universal stress protein, UspA family n=1 Tax=Krasilnikoviella flava TaxID=526729 RepID=A0A1T5ISV6_9MICO|nr:universal stress protein [Krasilnikoviella flava]SKC42182.1 Nucleotide-binding universal stress protein, UspA family [Krasilnikoviella flava]